MVDREPHQATSIRTPTSASGSSRIATSATTTSRKDFALTDDLDAMFAELSSYHAAGGGDVPENVDAALYDAVHKMKWRDGREEDDLPRR